MFLNSCLELQKHKEDYLKLGAELERRKRTIEKLTTKLKAYDVDKQAAVIESHAALQAKEATISQLQAEIQSRKQGHISLRRYSVSDEKCQLLL